MQRDRPIKCSTVISLMCVLLSISFADEVKDSVSNVDILFNAYGKTTLGVYIYGKNRYVELAPGYRADFMIYTDIIRYKNLCFNFLSGATTSIARLPETPIKMDKIRYILVPGLRYPFRKTVVNVQLLHECIHTISREEQNGSAWWNSIQVGAGTKGSYHYYLIEKYNRREFSLRNSFDVQYKIGYYLHGKATLIGSNHNYRADGSGLVRYHVGLFHNQTIYIDLLNHLWIERDSNVTFKTAYEVNWVVLAQHNIATFFFNHCIQDANPFDNEAKLISLGFKVVF